MGSSRDETLRPLEVVRRLGLSADATVADVGAGEAYFTLLLSAAVPHGRVIATDLRPGALGIVRRRAAASGCGNVETRRTQPRECGLGPQTVDLAFLCQVDHHLDDRVDYYRGLTEALRSSGRMAVLNFGQYLAVNKLSAREVGLEITDEWWPSSGFFLLLLARKL